MSPTILPCEARHIGEIAAIYRHAVRHGTASFELEPPGEEEMLSRWQALLAAGYPYLVAERDGQVTGYAYAGPYRARPAYRATVENSIYIHPEQQGRGVGELLMSRLIDACTSLGFRQMVAVIGDSANVPSQRLHERLGFELVGVLKSV
ncbi:MAG TPA: GNAT family N-acetyltransferase, partial [Sinorhizobium sp.]|nr:GNAT family N-acetyltransferase [Sinorhizobium sp.]